MRIATWNVSWINKKTLKLLKFALEHKPDILCLQEVPSNILRHLQTIPDYHLYFTDDFQNANTEKNSYICTLTRIQPEYAKKIQYFDAQGRSILHKFLYQKILRNNEQHNAITVTIQGNRKKYCIINARLSSAIGINTRLEQFQRMLLGIPEGEIPILCGDFNIADGRFFNWITGWLRGFKLDDYWINERKAFEKLIGQHNLINIFYRTNTTIFRPLKLQFDHILTQKNIQVTHKEISKKSFGSDHKMLLADIQIS